MHYTIRYTVPVTAAGLPGLVVKPSFGNENPGRVKRTLQSPRSRVYIFFSPKLRGVEYRGSVPNPPVPRRLEVADSRRHSSLSCRGPAKASCCHVRWVASGGQRLPEGAYGVVPEAAAGAADLLSAVQTLRPVTRCRQHICAAREDGSHRRGPAAAP